MPEADGLTVPFDGTGAVVDIPCPPGPPSEVDWLGKAVVETPVGNGCTVELDTGKGGDAVFNVVSVPVVVADKVLVIGPVPAVLLGPREDCTVPWLVPVVELPRGNGAVAEFEDGPEPDPEPEGGGIVTGPVVSVSVMD